MPKDLIIFYSRTNKTRLIAHTIAKEKKANIIEIKDLKRRSGILGYIFAGYDAIKENPTRITHDIIDLKKYNKIFICTPLWASKAACAIQTYVSKTNFENKKCITVFSMGGNNAKNAQKRLRIQLEYMNGKVINSLAIQTSKKKENQIIDETKKLIKKI